MKSFKKILCVVLALIDILALTVAILCFALLSLPEIVDFSLTDSLIEALPLPFGAGTILVIALVSTAIFFGLRYIIQKVFKKSFLLRAVDDAPIEYFIRFEGELSGECRDYALSKIKRNALYIALFIGLPWVGTFSLLAIFIGEFALIFLLLNLVPILVSLIFWVIASKPERLEKSLPQSVFIEADKQFAKMKNKTLFKGALRSLSSVKEVLDYGEFYQLVFRLDGASNLFICQKNLLTIGTLADFEWLFAGKIVKMQALKEQNG